MTQGKFYWHNLQETAINWTWEKNGCFYKLSGLYLHVSCKNGRNTYSRENTSHWSQYQHQTNHHPLKNNDTIKRLLSQAICQDWNRSPIFSFVYNDQKYFVVFSKLWFNSPIKYHIILNFGLHIRENFSMTLWWPSQLE